MPSRRQKRENIRQYKCAVRQKDALLLQKKSLAEELRNNAVLSGFFLVMTCSVILVGTFAKQPSAFLGVIPMAALAILFACFVFRSAGAYRQMCRIKTAAAEEKEVCVQKIKLWMIPGYRGASWIRCVVLVDKNNERYYYVYPLGQTPIGHFAKVIKSRCLYQTVDVSCYKNTRFISHIIY